MDTQSRGRGAVSVPLFPSGHIRVAGHLAPAEAVCVAKLVLPHVSALVWRSSAPALWQFQVLCLGVGQEGVAVGRTGGCFSKRPGLGSTELYHYG